MGTWTSLRGRTYRILRLFLHQMTIPVRVCPTSPEPPPRLHAYQELNEANSLFWVAVGGNVRIAGSTPARSPHWLTLIASARIWKDNHRV
jgi:hypothetical protein